MLTESPLKKQMFDALFGAEGSMTKAEFNAAFRSIIEQIIRFEKRLLDKNTEASDQLKHLFAGFKYRVETKTDADVAAFKKQVNSVIYDAIDRFEERLTTASEDFAAVKLQVANFKEPLDGKDGKDGSPDTGEQIVGKINSDKNTKKIKLEKIEGLRELATWVQSNHDNLSKLWLRSGGLVGTIIAGSGISVDSTDPGQPIVTATGGFTVKAATGTIDDSNTTFTFASEPTIVIVNGAVYRHGSGVTISGTTATLDNPAGTGGSVFGI